jgi:hypothetical protein
MKIHGIESWTLIELELQLAKGARFVFFEYCVSLVALTARRSSGIYFLRAGDKGLVKGLRFSLVSLLLGWWGVPWGLIYAPLTIVTNFKGGCDVTAEVVTNLTAQLSKPR